ncbi:MAG TPA: PKD domain-containing protein [Thermoplasmata archaeon]|nr:PKD domain-containing protein [Thermoplasmata archaeon]
MIVDRKAGLLWVGREGSGTLLGLNLTTLNVSVTSAPFTINSSDPQGLAFAPGPNQLFAIDSDHGNVAEFNASTGAMIGGLVSVGANCTALAFDPFDGLLYVAGDTLQAIDPTTLAPEGPTFGIPSHSVPAGLAIDLSTETLFLSTSSPTNGSGEILALAGDSVSGLAGSIVTASDGQSPIDPQMFHLSSPNTNGSDFLLTANAADGTVGVVGSPPTIESFRFDPNPVDTGATTHGRLVVSGGVGRASVSYDGLPTGCASLGRQLLNCTPSAVGTFPVTVVATDSIGQQSTASINLTVTGALEIQPSFAPGSDLGTDVRSVLSVNASASGGLPPYNYSWSFGDGTIGYGASVSHAYGGTGAYVLEVRLSDAAGGDVSASAVVQVYTYPTVDPVAVNGSSGSLTTDVGLPTALDGQPAGGAPPRSENWTFGDGTSASGAQVVHAWSTPGVYDAKFTYVDGAGRTAIGTVGVLVEPDMSANFTVAPAGSATEPGATYDFSAQVTGGDPPYNVTWSFGSGRFATGADVATSFPAAGAYSVTVRVTDQAGGVRGTTISVQVPSQSSTAGSWLGGNFGPGLALGLFVGAAVAAGILFTVERGRRRTLPAPPSPYVPPPERTTPGKRT